VTLINQLAYRGSICPCPAQWAARLSRRPDCQSPIPQSSNWRGSEGYLTGHFVERRKSTVRKPCVFFSRRRLADDEPAELSELSGIGDVDGSPEQWLAGCAI
jgi:hypothetical protein